MYDLVQGSDKNSPLLYSLSPYTSHILYKLDITIGLFKSCSRGRGLKIFYCQGGGGVDHEILG